MSDNNKDAPRKRPAIASENDIKKRRKWQLRELNNNRRTNDDVHSSIELCPVMSVMIDTPHFQRLRDIKQLGLIEYVYMNANHKRFEHSIGVAHLAEKVCRRISVLQPQLGTTEKDILCVKLAGLLHDIGHGPYSHVYEHFREMMKRKLQTDAQLQNEYIKKYPAFDESWTHEHGSLMVIDDLLKYLGLEIDKDNLDAPLKPIGDGIANTSMRVYYYYHHAKQEDILTSRDFIFVKECILGRPLYGEEEFVGRTDRNKEWLYDIVCNRHNGLDVDKMDYYARDDRRAFKGSGEVALRLVEEARVAWGACPNPGTCRQCLNQKNTTGMHLMICYTIKMVENVNAFFNTRFKLHCEVYKHKTGISAEHLLCDILCLADPHFLIPTTEEDKDDNNTALPMSIACSNPTAYLQLTDSVIAQIARTRDPELAAARKLIRDRLRPRNLYKRVGEKILNVNDNSFHKDIFNTFNDNPNALRNEMLAVPGVHTDPNNNVELKLAQDDFFFEISDIHRGSKDENPLKRVRFVLKEKINQLFRDDLPEAVQVDPADYAAHSPQAFRQVTLFVFARDKDDLVAHVFEKWWADKEDGGFPVVTVEAQNSSDMEEFRELTQESVGPASPQSQGSDVVGTMVAKAPRPTFCGIPT